MQNIFPAKTSDDIHLQPISFDRFDFENNSYIVLYEIQSVPHFDVVVPAIEDENYNDSDNDYNNNNNNNNNNSNNDNNNDNSDSSKMEKPTKYGSHNNKRKATSTD